MTIIAWIPGHAATYLGRHSQIPGQFSIVLTSYLAELLLRHQHHMHVPDLGFEIQPALRRLARGLAMVVSTSISTYRNHGWNSLTC